MLNYVISPLIVVLLIALLFSDFLPDDIYYYVDNIGTKILVFLLGSVVLCIIPKREFYISAVVVLAIIINLSIGINFAIIALKDDQRENFYLVGGDGEYKR